MKTNSLFIGMKLDRTLVRASSFFIVQPESVLCRDVTFFSQALGAIKSIYWPHHFVMHFKETPAACPAQTGGGTVL
jgi:hypothetical protein